MACQRLLSNLTLKSFPSNNIVSKNPPANDDSPLNIKCRLCSDRDETVNHISKCIKLAQKENKRRHAWVGTVNHEEMCKSLKFGHADEWYIHKLEALLVNEMHKILWKFEMQTNPLTPTWRPHLVTINKKKSLSPSEFCCASRSKSDSKNKS